MRSVVTAAPATFDLAGRRVETWAFGNRLGGEPIRARAGDILEVSLKNDLPEDTTIHWHGLALRNDMDGVHDLTQSPVKPGDSFTYRFALAHPGTYFFHPHVGLQLDRALYAPLIIDDPAEPGRYDAEHVLVLDDWLDGFDTRPDLVLQELKKGHAMPGMDHSGTSPGPPTSAPAPMPGMDHSMPMSAPGAAGGGLVRRAALMAPGDEHGNPADGQGAPAPRVGAAMGEFTSPALGGDAGDVAYPLHLINGRPPADRATFDAAPGGRVRFRIINAGSDTAYRFAIGGHRLTVTHTDGFPVEPLEVDAVIVGMGERYDVVVTAQSGAWPIVAAAEGKNASAVAVLRTTDAGATPAPAVDAMPSGLTGQVLDYKALRAADAVRLGGKPDRVIDIDLVGDMMTYKWGIRVASADGAQSIEIEEGQRIRFNLRNTTSMWHPMHLHGHTFGLAHGEGGARKDTVNVLPGETVPIDFVADNPGQWMMHCHNTYHLEGGMAAKISYLR